jgi:hypothetical protein
MRLTENQLRGLIHKTILREAMVMPEKLGDNFRIVVINSGWDMTAKSYSPTSAYEVNLYKKYDHGEFEVGTVAVSYSLSCSSYEIVVSFSDYDKYGPLLYDIAIEVAGDLGLIPDRGDVSEAAGKVWSYYLRKRWDISSKPITSNSCGSPRSFFPDGKDKFGRFDWSNWIYYQTNGTPMTDRLLKLNKISFVG